MKLVIYGTPTPKGRPKIAMRGKFPSVYTPKKTREAEQNFISQLINQRPKTLLTGPLKIIIKFYRLKPKSYSKKLIHWIQKPDLDNLIKLVLDAMNKVFFQDDSQIIQIESSKEFAEIPRTEIEIQKI